MSDISLFIIGIIIIFALIISRSASNAITSVIRIGGLLFILFIIFNNGDALLTVLEYNAKRLLPVITELLNKGVDNFLDVITLLAQ